MMTPPNSYHAPASNTGVYERHGHHTTAATARSRHHDVGAVGNNYTTPTKPPAATAAGAATTATPGTVVDESFDSTGGRYSGGGHREYYYDGDHHDQDDLNSELAIADDGHENGISHERRSTQIAIGGGAASNSNAIAANASRAGIREVPPVGPNASPSTANSNASLKSGVPGRSPVAGLELGGAGLLPNGGGASSNGGAPPSAAVAATTSMTSGVVGVGAPPLMSIKTKKKKSSAHARSQKYEEQIAAEAAMARYYAEEEPYDAAATNSSAAPVATAAAAASTAAPSSDLRQPHPALDITNPFDDSFDTAAVNNVAAARTTGNTSGSTSAIKAVKARQQRLQQEQQQRVQKQREAQQQQQQQQQQAALLQGVASTESATAAAAAAAHLHRAEKAPTPTNANLSVPRAPSNASAGTHAGPLDDGQMTILSAETGESWRRAEEEFAAAEAEARRERASWGQQGRVRSHDENADDEEDDDFAAAAAAAAVGKRQQQQPTSSSGATGGGGGKRQGILKASSARTKQGRNHPWDKKSGAANNADRGGGGDDDDDNGDDDDNTLFEFEDEASKKQRAGLKADRERKQAERRASAEGGIKRSTSHDSAMSGSSFDRRRSGGRGGRRGRSSDDDESLSTDEPTRRDRTQEAWKRKNTVPSRTRSAPRAGRSGSAVAFAQDTVHHFENDDESTVYTRDDSLISARYGRRARRDDEAYSDDDTYTSRRTSGTDYSGMPKSYESEVEDLVKDFLFIGRSAKSQPGSQRKTSHVKKDRYRDEESTYNGDDGTIGTYDESTYGGTRDESTFVTRDESTYVSRDSRTSGDDQTYESADPSLVKEKRKKAFANKRSARKVDDDDGTLMTEMSADVVKKSAGPCGQEKPCGDDNPLAAVWGLMEGGLDAMSQALGLSGDAAQQEGTTTSNSPSRNQSMGTKRSATTNTAAGLAGLVDYASDFVFGPAPSNDTGIFTDEAPSSRHVTPTHSADASIDKEAGLVELSLCAAKAKHMTSGVPFDESAEIDVVNDIKFNVITTALPLGLLFQENSAGVWVAKVFTSGNAANSAVGKGVQVGDQLAAVNGNSTIKLTVDEVCDMISSSPNTNEIELTFLRYVGPLHNKRRGKARSPSPIRRSKGSGLFNRSALPVPAVDKSAAPPKQKKGLFGRTRSKSNPRAKSNTRPEAPVPSISQSASSDFLGEYDGISKMGASQATGATGKSKKKRGFFGRKKK